MRMTRRHRLRLAVPLVMTLGACASGGGPTSDRASAEAAPIARGIVLCRTTLAELRSQLGEPDRDGISHTARVVSWIIAWEPLVRYFAVFPDEREVVMDPCRDVPTGIPWTPKNQCRP